MPMKPTTKAKKELQVAERRRKAADYRKQGYSLREIAGFLSCSHETIRQDIEHGLSELRADTLLDVESYRAIQVARREEMINAHRPTALDPENEKASQSASIVDRNEAALSKLMGTEAPVQTENKTELSGDYGGPSVIIEMAESAEEPSVPDVEDEAE